MVHIDPKHPELEGHVVAINRITKVVKGGRRLRFATLVAASDKNGHVSFGTGKAQEVPGAICKAIENAKKNLVRASMAGSTIPHEIIGVFGGDCIFMKPTVEGPRVAAGGSIHAVLELAGVADITSKSPGSNMLIDVVHATVEGLEQPKRAEGVAALRGKSIEGVIGQGRQK